MKSILGFLAGGLRRRAQKKTAGRDGFTAGSAGWQSEFLSRDLKTNLAALKAVFYNCSDVVFREFVFAQNERVKLALVYVDGLADRAMAGDLIVRALALEVPVAAPGLKIGAGGALEFIKQQGLCVHQVGETRQMREAVLAVLSGDAVLLVDGCDTALINGIRHWEKRSITDPEAEPTVRGSREAFVETLRVNTSLIRRRIKDPRLKIEALRLGEVTRTEAAILYLEGVAPAKIVEEVKNRIGKIKVDHVLESGNVEELIEDNPFSVFPTVNHTEKPDRVAAMILEGRVAVLVDGTPFALTVPNLFVEYLQASEDYYERFIFSSAVRLIRFLSMTASLVLPSLYIAVVSYHPELLPTTLLLSIAAQREAVPFPIFVEALIMELTFEILREAGIRLPRPIGQAVSIVGALVVGEAAVRAGLVAAATVIVVALTGIASFTFSYSASIAFRILRFLLLAASAAMGLFGLITGLALIGIHLCGLRSFGVPYLYPLVPVVVPDLKDTFVRAPFWAMLTRPRLLARFNQKRAGKDLKPARPRG